MGLLGSVIGGVARGVGGLFVKQVSAVAEDGTENVNRRATRFTKAAGVIVGLALLYHFLLWPSLNFHFPEYGFPPIDADLLSILAGLGM